MSLEIEKGLSEITDVSKLGETESVLRSEKGWLSIEVSCASRRFKSMREMYKGIRERNFAHCQPPQKSLRTLGGCFYTRQATCCFKIQSSNADIFANERLTDCHGGPGLGSLASMGIKLAHRSEIFGICSGQEGCPSFPEQT